jgi:hypothetical protein
LAIKPLYGRCVALDRYDGSVVQLQSLLSKLTFKAYFQSLLSKLTFKAYFQILLSNLTFKSYFQIHYICVWNCHHFHNFLNIQLLVSLHIPVCAYVYMYILEYVNIDNRQFDNNYHIPKSAYVMLLEKVSDNRNSTDWRWVRILEIFCHCFVIMLGLKGQLSLWVTFFKICG